MTCPVTPWVDLIPVLKLYAPELLDPDTGLPINDPMVAVWDTAICEATWVLFTLAGGKVHPQQCWVEDYSTRGGCHLTLRRTPLAAVLKVEAVRDCGAIVDELPLTDWCLVSSNTIDFCCATSADTSDSRHFVNNGAYSRRGCGCQDRVVRVHYQIGSTLPPGTQVLVAWLADQYVKAATGQKCSLPERVTSVTRQGVSWTMLDPMDFLDKRFTGMGRIDSWLATVRMAYPSAEYIDPLRSNRVFSQQVSCGGGPFQHREFGGGAEQPTNEPFDIPDEYRQAQEV